MGELQVIVGTHNSRLVLSCARLLEWVIRLIRLTRLLGISVGTQLCKVVLWSPVVCHFTVVARGCPRRILMVVIFVAVVVFDAVVVFIVHR